ncbi:MAG TPA: hypothetical protein VMN60_08020 [Longimicrobiales bacterium]|nr:hypothetical protein [Longimicrobiales bacterium]
MPVLLALALASLAAPPGGVPDAFKCQKHTVPGHIVVVDDVVVRDYRGDGPAPILEDSGMPDRDDILSIEVRCLAVRPAEPGAAPVMRSAVIILTKSGAPRVMEAQLTELVEEQRLHRERTGRYAATLAELKFFDSRTELPIQLSVNDDGWSAAVRLASVPTACQVAVGAADSAVRPGVPLCR